jgi:hypothetical protein
MWEAKGGFKDILLEEIAKITVGSPLEPNHYMGPVMFVPILSRALLQLTSEMTATRDLSTRL